MADNIDPFRQVVSECLNGRTYAIDFYQREYVWGKETVETLLKDIFFAFDQSYEMVKSAELTPELMDQFNWYYLNVIITNSVDGKTYIVDGQQRLTTLTLLLTSLFHLTDDQKLKGLILPCIYGQNWKENIYRIDHNKRKKAMDCIVNNVPDSGEYESVTEENIINRYKDISTFLEKRNLQPKELEAFIFFVLKKLVLVELSIKNQNDTAMVFEVINDRGEALKPFEILKGKLIGCLNKADTDAYSKKWDEALKNISGKEDRFFSTYIKSRFVFSRNSEREGKINSSYHRYLYEDNEDARKMGFRRKDPNRLQRIKSFISNDLRYYSRLFAKIVDSDNEFIAYSRDIHDMDGQFLLMMSACIIDDPDEDLKISIIAKEYDRLHMLLKLAGVYSSTEMLDLNYQLNEQIKNTPVTEYRTLFDNSIKEKICEKKSLTSVSKVIDYSWFSQLGYETGIEKRSLRYLLSRVELLICRKINKDPEDTVYNMSTRTSNVYGYHIEHILSDNSTNRAYFNDDEELFYKERNKLGGLLLLRGLENISSGNEEYPEKLATYSHGPNWGHTLCRGYYNSNPLFDSFNRELRQETGVGFVSYDNQFTPQSLAERSRLLFELAKIIWEAF